MRFSPGFDATDNNIKEAVDFIEEVLEKLSDILLMHVIQIGHDGIRRRSESRACYNSNS